MSIGPLARAVRLAGGPVLAVAVAGCASPAPSVDATRVLHLESQVTQAVLVGVSKRGSEGFFHQNVLRQCGGRLDLTIGREIPSVDDWIVGLGIDPSGRLDSAMDTWSGDPRELPEGLLVVPIWTRGDIRAADLPEWVTVTAEGTVQADTPPSEPTDEPCAAYAVPTEP